MNRDECIAIEAACARLSIRFAQCVDHGDASGVAAVFTEDGVFSRAGHDVKGAGEIAAFAGRRMGSRVTRHVCTNIIVDVQSQTAASATTYFTLFEGERKDDTEPLPLQLPITVGEYLDQFALTDAGWRIAARKAIAIFRREEAIR